MERVFKATIPTITPTSKCSRTRNFCATLKPVTRRSLTVYRYRRTISRSHTRRFKMRSRSGILSGGRQKFTHDYQMADSGGAGQIAPRSPGDGPTKVL